MLRERGEIIMTQKLIIANWKMNLPVGGIAAFAEKITKPRPSNLIIAPPYPFLSHVRGQGFQIAAQDVSANDNKNGKGAFTGEVAADMLMQVGVQHCIVGHSERRQYYHEDHELLAKKIIQLLNHHIIPIFCVGEQRADYEDKKTNEVLSAQLSALSNFKGKEIIIAYEPVWAIGTGAVATTDHMIRVHQYLKGRLGGEVKVLYGGSVNASNAAAILSLKEVDGLLIGAASLKAEEMMAILGG